MVLTFHREQDDNVTWNTYSHSEGLKEPDIATVIKSLPIKVKRIRTSGSDDWRARTLRAVAQVYGPFGDSDVQHVGIYVTPNLPIALKYGSQNIRALETNPSYAWFTFNIMDSDRDLVTRLLPINLNVWWNFYFSYRRNALFSNVPDIKSRIEKII
ncbi:MAG TPA: hypothetical protein VJJ76_01210 [archaeon]|nr:hypothetical protein [archaeon]